MYVSLNKKFMCVFFMFFMLIIGLFLGFFSVYYDRSIAAEERHFMITTARLMEVAYDNNYLVGQLKKAVEEQKIEPDGFIQKIIEEDNNAKNHRIIEGLNNIYNTKYDRLRYLWRFVGAGMVWISVSVVLLWFLLQYMVLRPVNKLIAVSKEVSSGNFAQRVRLKDKVIDDEFTILGTTFNHMLENIEESITKIKNNQYFLQSIIDAIPDGLRVMDKEGRIILANRTYKNLLGVKKCVGERCYVQSMNSTHICSGSKVLCPIKEFEKAKSASLSTVQYFANDPNRPISVNAAKMIIDDNGTKTEYIIEALRDLSHEIKFSHQQKISSLAFLATSIAHEMKNNLGSLRLIMEQLLVNKAFADEREEGYFKLAYNQLLECIKIPESLLNLAKNSSDKTDNIKLKNLVEGVCSLLDYEAKQKGISVNMQLDDSQYVIGNEPDFKMIFLNLCQNAIKAMPGGGRLEIEAKTKANAIEIYVKDNGVGIEKSKQKRIFEPFFSVGDGTNSVQSTGLGLPIVKSLVENFSGKIKFVSKKNTGTTFIMIFPMKK